MHYYISLPTWSAHVGRAKREAVKTANRDFVFILDTSGSILGSEFTLAKEAISSLIEAFCPVKFGKCQKCPYNKQA